MHHIDSKDGTYMFAISRHVYDVTIIYGGTQRRGLRHSATKRKVAGSIPDGLTGTLHGHNPSDCKTVLGSTLPLTEMNTRNISRGVKGGRCVGLTTIPPSCANCLEIWNPRCLPSDCLTTTDA